eukprot:13834645-Alexandrium_andersonii.AAC.1
MIGRITRPASPPSKLRAVSLKATAASPGGVQSTQRALSPCRPLSGGAAAARGRSQGFRFAGRLRTCLLYTSDAADDM